MNYGVQKLFLLMGRSSPGNYSDGRKSAIPDRILLRRGGSSAPRVRIIFNAGTCAEIAASQGLPRSVSPRRKYYRPDTVHVRAV